jgi:hypothetical protein
LLRRQHFTLRHSHDPARNAARYFYSMADRMMRLQNRASADPFSLR